MEEKPEPKISLPEAFFLITAALILDLVSIIPGLNEVTAITATAGFQLYFFMRGIPGWYVSLGANVIEFIPVISAFPAITLGVIGVIMIDRATATKLGQTTLKATGPAQKFVGPKA